MNSTGEPEQTPEHTQISASGTLQPSPWKHYGIAGLFGLFLVGALSATSVWWWQSTPAGAGMVEEEPELPVTAADPGYLGPQACAECHTKRLAECEQTPHFRACRPARAGDMPPGFASGKSVHQTHDPSLRFEMTANGNEFMHTAVRTTSRGEQRSPQQIDLVYGVTKSDEIFFSWKGNQLFELTVAWIHPLKRWANASYNHHGSGEFLREATPRCLECHNTQFDHVAGTMNEYRRDKLILGVTCERCHGPGRDHVAFHKGKAAGELGKAIVHPRHLSRERRLEVCLQCHSNTPKNSGPAFSYRPGEVMANYYRTATSKYPEEDHVANQIKYLRPSKCFTKSEMTCTTCHNPHRANTPEEVAGACAKCHKPENCREQPRLPKEVQANCVGCHMPDRYWMNVHFHTSDDHFVPAVRRHDHHIGIHPWATQEVLRKHYRAVPGGEGNKTAQRLERQLVEHWLAEATTLEASKRHLAAIGALREALRVAPNPEIRERLDKVVKIHLGINNDLVEGMYQVEKRRLPEAIETFKRLLKVKPDYAVAHGKLGAAYAAVGEKALAVKHLSEVATHDPDDAYGCMMLGWLAYLDGRAEEAIEYYRKADEIEPFNSKTHYHWALALIKAGRTADAVKHYRQVLTIDPNHTGASQGLGHALRVQGELGKALWHARRAAEQTQHQNADILLTLAKVQLEAGRQGEAEETAQRALTLAEATNPGLVTPARQTLKEIRGSKKGKKK